jgi:hypothetical protein
MFEFQTGKTHLMGSYDKPLTGMCPENSALEALNFKFQV